MFRIKIYIYYDIQGVVFFFIDIIWFIFRGCLNFDESVIYIIQYIWKFYNILKIYYKYLSIRI